MTKPGNFIHRLLHPFKSGKSASDGEELEKLAAKEQKLFTFETLVSATKNFNDTNKLGQGGFGPVYKGILEDGREIAVKKLSRGSSQGKKEFANEAKLLARVQHRNIVGLLGYCVHGEEKLLVYDFVANESLDKTLFRSFRGQNVLDWRQRYDIIVGITRGLLYLHEDSHLVIIHRDIKASNILLDDKWIPKIADFGMARLFPEDHTHVNTRVAGTNGYMAPEYLMHGRLSAKADVFSFGVVVLELITGQKNSSFSPISDGQNLLEWAYKLYKRGKSLEIVDHTLASSVVPEQVATCIKIGLLCVQSDPQQRPTMRRVVVMLSKKPDSLEEPTRPGCPGSRYRKSRHPTQSSSIVSTSSRLDSNSFGSSITTTTSSAASSAAIAAASTSYGKRPI